MTEKARTLGFELSLSARNDGTLEAAYIRLRKGKMKRTDEVVEEALLADYDQRGQLLGIEILAPVRLSELAKLVERLRRAPFRRFLAHAAPADFVRP